MDKEEILKEFRIEFYGILGEDIGFISRFNEVETFISYALDQNSAYVIAQIRKSLPDNLSYELNDPRTTDDDAGFKVGFELCLKKVNKALSSLETNIKENR